MTADASDGLNRFGYAVGTAVTLALGLLLVGGRSYAPYAALLGLLAAFCLAWAMRRTESERDRRSSEDEERERREKEAEKAAHSGGGW